MLRAKCMLNDFGSRIKILISQNEGTKRIANGVPMVFKKNKDCEETEATLEFDLSNKEELATFVLDWVSIAETACINLNTGFSKEKEAILNHLEDMRELVFKGKQRANGQN